MFLSFWKIQNVRPGLMSLSKDRTPRTISRLMKIKCKVLPKQNNNNNSSSTRDLSSTVVRPFSNGATADRMLCSKFSLAGGGQYN